MGIPYLKACLCILALLAAGCTQKTTVVLLSDQGGQVGSLSVANSAGEVEMTRPAEATVVSGRQSPPGKPKILSEEQIAAQFSEVLAALPMVPKHFLLYFEIGTTRLTHASEAMLPQILQTIKDRNSEHIAVIGHSDTAGERDYNLGLSTERAEAVSRLLVRQGIPHTHITSTSHGEDNLLIKTADEVHEERNRRVEVVIK